MNDHPPEMIGAGGHLYAARVYYEDTDAGGVVYHANYLRFAERARTEALRAAGVSHAEMAAQHGLIFMVRRLKLDYLAPARLDDSLLVVSRPVALRAASVELRQSIFRSGENRPLVVLEVLLACVRMADRRPGRLPARWRVALMSLSQGRESADMVSCNASFGSGADGWRRFEGNGAWTGRLTR